jgi:hypothetical protein
VSTATIVVVAIWNALLLTALTIVITRRAQVIEWITRLDGQDRHAWDRPDDEWKRFLAEHPELVDR